MDFIELTNAEYKQILKRLIWRTPFIQLWGMPIVRLLFFIVLAICVLAAYSDADIIRFFDPVFVGIGIGDEWGTLHAVLSGISMTLAFWTAAALLVMLLLIPRRRHHVRYRKNFLETVGRLDTCQTEKLLSEYAARKKIELYYSKTKRVAGSGALYITENFLFVPGLFLVSRHEVEKVEVTRAFIFIGSIRIPTSITLIYFHFKSAKPQYLPLDYKYKKSPETAEQVMAWFWQCDPNDPMLSQRTKDSMVNQLLSNY